MTINLNSLLLFVALLSFALAAASVPTKRLNLIGLGLFCWCLQYSLKWF